MQKLTLWLESSLLAGSVLHLAHLSLIIDVTVLAVHLSVRVLGLDLERTIGGLVAKGIRSVVIVTVQLLQDGNWCCCRLGDFVGVVTVVVRLLLLVLG